MQRLRRGRHLARLVLAWFGLYIAVATLSPLLGHAEAAVIVCTSAGTVHAAAHAGDAGYGAGQADMKCPLCMPMGGPVPGPNLEFGLAQPLGHLLQSIPAARIAAITAAPPPARGPPSDLHA